MSLDPRVAIRSMEILSDQISDLEDRNKDLAGAVSVLAKAIRDIEEIADDNVDIDSHSWNTVSYFCKTGGVQTAMGMT